MSVTLEQLNTAIADTLRTVSALKGGVQDIDELSEGIQDWPLAQVYWERYVPDTRAENNERTTFGAGVRVAGATFHIDGFVAKANHLGQNMLAVVQVADAVIAKLDAQRTKPYFGLTGIQGFRWTMERATFPYADQTFRGFRVVLDLVVF